MTPLTLILRGARFYWRRHLGVILGVALATVVLTGSLLTGDAVKSTLRHQAELRVGQADIALTGGDHFFRKALADDPTLKGAPVIMLRSTIAKSDSGARVNSAQLLGVDQRFWKLSPNGTPIALANEGVAINRRLAEQLETHLGDTLVIRVEKPGAFSRDAPLSGNENEVVALRLKVTQIVEANDYGRFALTASQVPPFTAFVPIELLEERLALRGKSNLILAKAQNNAPPRQGIRWDLADADLEIRTLPNQSGFELRSSRVFLDPAFVAITPQGKSNQRTDALTYFVNELRAGEKSTPYSMVTAVAPTPGGFLPLNLANDEIVISPWLADDLHASIGDEVTLKYFVIGDRRALLEQTRKFKVRAVLPTDLPELNNSWMPDFPGLSDQANCRDWKPGFAFDATKMRDQDQAYWEKYRGTPKAFLNLQVGEELWGNRWGKITSMRWPAEANRQEIVDDLNHHLSPEQLGFQLLPLRKLAIDATNAPVDFGELFLCFSIFLIVAAAGLTGLLFTFSLDERRTEVGLLLSLGLRRKQVRALLLSEGIVLALIGGGIGAPLAVLYTNGVIWALSTAWRNAVSTTEFVITIHPLTLASGIIFGVLVGWLSMVWATWKFWHHTSRELLADAPEEFDQRQSNPTSFAAKNWRGLIAPFCLLGAGALLVSNKSAETFFGAGALLLISGLLLSARALRHSKLTANLASLTELGWRNATRRQRQSLTIIGVLASGVFIVVAVDAFRQKPLEQTTQRDTGTGGFALIGESSLPIYDDLNTQKGREVFALDDQKLAGVKIVPIRVQPGDDASCLNLNRAITPRILGVNPQDLASRNAFKFAKSSPSASSAPPPTQPTPPQNTWQLLNRETTANQSSIPAIVDANTLQWALQKKLGESIDAQDERGRNFQEEVVATLAGSILQGSVIISEKHFIEKFPSVGGYRFFLIDCPQEQIASVKDHLSRQLADRGLELTLTSQKLGDFQAVENTYLAIFQSLGGLGLLLASAGLALVIARGVVERRREFAILSALGFTSGQLRSLVFAEHRWLIVLGLAIGSGSALVAVWPTLQENRGVFPYTEVGMLLGGLFFTCTLGSWLAALLALRGITWTTLRSE